MPPLNPISVLLDAIANAQSAAGDLGQAIVQQVETGYQQALSFINSQSGLGPAILNIVPFANDLVEAVQTGYQQAQAYIQGQGGLGPALLNATPLANNIVEAIQTGYRQAQAYIQSQGGLGSAIINAVTVANNLLSAVQTGYQQAQAYIQSQGGLGNTLTSAIGGVGNLGSAIANTLGNIPGQISNTLSGIGGTLASAVGGLGGQIQSAFSNLPGFFSGFQSGFQQAIANAQQMGNAVHQVGEEGNILQKVFAGITKVLKGGSEFVQTAFGFNEIGRAISTIKEIADPIFENLIAQNVELRQQVQSTAAQLAATQQISVNNQVITDPSEKIKAATGPVLQYINQLRQDSLELAGVTTADLVPAYETLAKSSSKLGINLGQAEQLTIKLAAQATTLGLSAGQAQQELSSIAKGEINPLYNQLAKSLGLTDSVLSNLVAQGKLYDYIDQKTKAAVASQKEQAQTFNGVTSNLREIQQLTTQAAGAPLLNFLLRQLNSVYEFLKQNQTALQDFFVKASKGFVDVGNSVIQAAAPLAPVFGILKEAFSSLADASLDAVVGTLKSLAQTFGVVVQTATPFLQTLALVAQGIGAALDTPIGKFVAQFALMRLAVGQITPLLLSFATSGGGGIGSVITGITGLNGVLVTLTANGIGGLIPALRGLVLAELPNLAKLFGTLAANVLVSTTESVGNLATAFKGLGLTALADSFVTLQGALEGLQFGATASSLGEVAGAVGKVALQMSKLVAQVALAYAAFETFNEVFARFKDGGADFNDAAAKINANLADIQEAAGKASKATSDLIPDEPPPTDFIDGTLDQINKVQRAFNNLTGQPKDFFVVSTDAEKKLNDARVAVDNLGKASNKTIDYVKGLEKQINSGLKISGEAASTAQKKLTSDIDAVKQKIEEREKQPRSKANDVLISQAKDMQTQLENTKAGFDKLANSVEFSNIPLEKKGSLFKQLGEQADSALKKIKSPADSAELEDNAKRLIAITKEQREEGAITAQEAQERLSALAKDNRATKETQESAQKALTAILRQEGDNRGKVLEAELEKTQAAIASGNLSETTGAIEVTRIKGEQLRQQLEHVKDEIKQEEDIRQSQIKSQIADLTTLYNQAVTDKNVPGASTYAAQIKAAQQALSLSSQTIIQLKSQQDKTEAEITTNQAQAFKDRYNARLRFYDDEQKILDGSLATGQITEQQYNQKSFENTKAELQIKLQEIQRKRAQISSSDIQGLKDSAAEEAGVRKQQEGALEKFDNDQIARIERAQKKAVDAATLSETERLAQIEKLETAHTITHEQAEQQRANATGEFLKKRLQSENNAVIEQEKLPKVDDPIKQQQNQDKITAARIKAAQTAKELSANELRQQQENQKVFEELLNQRVQGVKNAVQSENLEYTRQEDYLNAVSKSLDNQVKLLQTQKEVQASISSYYESIAGVLEKTADNDEERKDAAETAAAIRLRSVQAQYDVELKILKANLDQKQTQLEIDKLKNNAAKAQNTADIAEATAKVATVDQNRKNLTPEEYRLQRQAAELNLGAKVEQGRTLDLTEQSLKEQEEINKQGRIAELANLQRKRTTDLLSAREGLADKITDPSVRAEARRAVRDEAFRSLIGTDNPDQEYVQPKRFNQQEEAAQFRNRFGNPINQAPLIPSTFQPQLTVPQFQLPPNPTLDGLRQQFSPESLAAAVKSTNVELIQAIGRLETVMKSVQSPVVNQTNSTTNNFDSGDVDTGTLAKKVEDQQRAAQYAVLKELERRAP